MSTKIGLYVFAIVVAAFAAWVWVDVVEQYSFAAPLMDYFNCTFGCSSHTVTAFWNQVILASFCTFAATCFASMASLQKDHWNRVDVLSV